MVGRKMKRKFVRAGSPTRHAPLLVPQNLGIWMGFSQDFPIKDAVQGLMDPVACSHNPTALSDHHLRSFG